jgi:hypothetical protein
VITENTAIAKEKLADGHLQNRALERLEGLLGSSETVVTMAQALFRSRNDERRGLAVLTDSRLLCVDAAFDHAPTLEMPLARISALETGVSGGSGGARRGEMLITSDGVRTDVLRIHPWERAAEMAAYVAAGVDEER